jgi:hypothetical protein
LKIVYEKYVEDLINISDVKTEFEILYSIVKKAPRIQQFEVIVD